MDTRTFTLDLPVKLNVTQAARIADEISDRLREKGQVLAEKREKMATYTGRIRELDESIDGLNLAYRAGARIQPVEVEEERDVDAGVMRVRRKDTGEVLAERPFEKEEAQLTIGEGEKPKRGRKRKENAEAAAAFAPVGKSPADRWGYIARELQDQLEKKARDGAADAESEVPADAAVNAPAEAPAAAETAAATEGA